MLLLANVHAMLDSLRAGVNTKHGADSLANWTRHRDARKRGHQVASASDAKASLRTLLSWRRRWTARASISVSVEQIHRIGVDVAIQVSVSAIELEWINHRPPACNRIVVARPKSSETCIYVSQSTSETERLES